MKEAIELLSEELLCLRGRTDFSSIPEKAEHYGLINRYEMAVDRLELCEKYGVTGGSIIKQLPDSGNIHFCYKVVNENESSNPCNWEEVLFDERQLTLESGDLVVKR